MKLVRRIVTACVVTWLVCGCAVAPAAVLPCDHLDFLTYGWSPDSQQILFATTARGSQLSYDQTYIMNADGSGLTRLTDGPSFNLQPAWSPDGTRIAFISNRSGISQVWAMNVDGSHQTRLTADPGPDWEPAWSPDGKWIAYSSLREDGPGVYMIPAGGGPEKLLAAVPEGYTRPAWMPDSRRVAYISREVRSNGVAYLHLYLADIGGGKPTELFSSSQNRIMWSDWPIVSPDGKAIAVATYNDQTYQTRVDYASVDGAPLPDHPLVENIPDAWSPDGRHVAYVAYDRYSNGYNIWTMAPDGSGQTRLTDPDKGGDAAMWSPDGRYILFLSERDGEAYNLYRMDADGSNPIRLTDNPGNHGCPH